MDFGADVWCVFADFATSRGLGTGGTEFAGVDNPVNF